MIDLDDLMAPLVGADLGDPPPVEVIHSRAMRRTARRRGQRRAFVVAGVALVAVLGVVGVMAAGDRGAGNVETLPADGSDGTTDREGAGGVGEEDGRGATDAPDVEPELSVGPDGQVGEPLLVGVFPYDMVSVDGEVWVLNKSSYEVTRIDAVEHRVRSRIRLPNLVQTPNRLAVTSDSVWVGGFGASSFGEPIPEVLEGHDGGAVARIDRISEEVTVLPVAVTPLAITAGPGGDVWVAGRPPDEGTEGVVAGRRVDRIDPATGESLLTSERLTGGLPVDLAVTADGVWVLLQANPGPSRLVHIDRTSGAVLGDVMIEHSGVRMVAAGDDLVIGTDTSGNAGRTGAVVVVDAKTRSVRGTVRLDLRPEAIAVTDELIITSGPVVLDRRTLQQRSVVGGGRLGGFAMALAGDELWLSTQPEGYRAGDPSEVRAYLLDRLLTG